MLSLILSSLCSFNVVFACVLAQTPTFIQWAWWPALLFDASAHSSKQSSSSWRNYGNNEPLCPVDAFSSCFFSKNPNCGQKEEEMFPTEFVESAADLVKCLSELKSVLIIFPVSLSAPQVNDLTIKYWPFINLSEERFYRFHLGIIISNKWYLWRFSVIWLMVIPVFSVGTGLVIVPWPNSVSSTTSDVVMSSCCYHTVQKTYWWGMSTLRYIESDRQTQEMSLKYEWFGLWSETYKNTMNNR